ncbi:hypothetical protein DAP22_22985 [Salmonella enterica subsp. enterica serovar Enteritidis]|nr:hypothetical protein [Salmonella enterica subsp. enterica]EEE8220488.1 hypothetical protein [Salmonella enterica subsp. enterica serovar Enteritidis]EHI7455527.1 hypothetical protein [Salmonella enterica]HAJ4205505.1 hypothetical protein [Escherichia coli]HCM4208663.1 hypothetical protein [Salmonella enterica subsp. enterica serovar Saintpaul]
MNIAKIFLFIILLSFIFWFIGVLLTKYQCNKIFKEAQQHGVAKEFLAYVNEYSYGIPYSKMDVVYRIALNQALTPKDKV